MATTPKSLTTERLTRNWINTHAVLADLIDRGAVTFEHVVETHGRLRKEAVARATEEQRALVEKLERLAGGPVTWNALHATMTISTGASIAQPVEMTGQDAAEIRDAVRRLTESFRLAEKIDRGAAIKKTFALLGLRRQP